MNDIQICNLALMKIGMPEITGFADPGNVAKMCGLYFPALRDRCLRDHSWRFATASATLQATTSTSFDSRYRYVCSLPGDLIRVLEIAGGEPYRIVGRQIFTNAVGGTLIYIRRVIDTEQFDGAFSKAWVYLLAAEWCRANPPDAQLVQSLRASYAERLAVARSLDSQENRYAEQPDPPHSDWLAARGYAGRRCGKTEWTVGTEGVQK